MIRYLAIVLLIYLFYRLVKLLVIGFLTRKRSDPDKGSKQHNPSTKRKIIPKDEGEYVDFEELKNDKGDK